MQDQDNFLPTMIGILERLHDKSAEHGQGMLAFLLDLARAEAEDALRTSGVEAQQRNELRLTSSVLQGSVN